MSIKIKVSYQDPEELNGLLRILRPIIQSLSLAKEQKGKYKRAYITVKPIKKEH